ncbi:site-specific DNA-methyltransferase [Patescibacteria group bacterium]|nr:MAG: site-specific DNA-methyltransferase [Patescibacteria group bacterium]
MSLQNQTEFKLKNQIAICHGDALNFYSSWRTPTVIVADGPYGVKGFPGDPSTPDSLDKWYEPHIAAWARLSTPQTTLWFWNTEIGWAKVHPILEKYGWRYRTCHIWDKGIGHVAGNANTKSLRKLPVVTEVCVQYVKDPIFSIDGRNASMKEWLRYEWQRSGLPLTLTNEACGVKDAATRKYFTQSDLWYFPPADAFEKLVNYANTKGQRKGAPYFSLDGKRAMTGEEWTRMRAKFYCPFGVTNVWNHPPVNGDERMKNGQKAMHLNQKPLKLTRLIIETTSDKGDVVWEPFGGLCTAAVAALELDRKCDAAEITHEVFQQAVARIEMITRTPKLNLQ